MADNLPPTENPTPKKSLLQHLLAGTGPFAGKKNDEPAKTTDNAAMQLQLPSESTIAMAFGGVSLSMLAMGFFVGMRRNVDKDSADTSAIPKGRQDKAAGLATTAPRRRAISTKPKTSAAPIVLVTKALGYGTVLCAVGATATAFGVSKYMGVNSLQEFSDRLKETLPEHSKTMLESIDPVLNTTRDVLAYPFQLIRPYALKDEEIENMDKDVYQKHAQGEYEELKSHGVPDVFLETFYADRSKEEQRRPSARTQPPESPSPAV